MDLDEWELIPSTKSFAEAQIQTQTQVMLCADIFVETNYFKLPTCTCTRSDQEQEDNEEEEPKKLKDIAISTEFEKETPVPVPAPASPPTPPVNWLEPDPVVFDRGMIARKAELVEKEDCDRWFSTLWRLPVNGIGAIFSFGVATAATLCVLALSTATASCRVRPNPSIQFQIYSDDKRIKDVSQRATELNHAISTARGVSIPIPTAQISFGGHYQGL